MVLLSVSVISPEKVLFEGEVESVVAPAYDGEVGILPNHAPMVTLLGKGTVRLGEGGRAGRFEIAGGFLQVADNKVRLVTEHASSSQPSGDRA
jgi:F-type H+-transporting ATPase subunit epsilon